VKFWPDNLWYDPDYSPALQQIGVEVLCGVECRDGLPDWLARHGSYLDYVLLSRPHVSRPVIDKVRKLTTARVLYYGHDVHHLRLAGQMKAEPGSLTSRDLSQAERWELELWRKADVVYYPAPAESAYVRTRVPRSSVRTIPVYAFSDVPPNPHGERARDRVMFVAGFAHRPNVQAARWLVGEVMPFVWRALPGTRLWIIGSSPPREVTGFADDRVVVAGFVPDDVLAEHYQRSRLAVAPLLYGAGMKGKVAEAMHFGLPCVATPTGAQGFEGVDGVLLVADTAAAFADGIVTLMRDDDAWTQLSRRAFDYARTNFSANALWDILSKDIDAAPYSSIAARTVRPANHRMVPRG
jgi:glycosyltransferase involved in cell wall biosynthesis